MPKLNGVDLAKRIKDIDKDIKLILMSAYDQTDISPPNIARICSKTNAYRKTQGNCFLCSDFKLNKNNSDEHI